MIAALLVLLALSAPVPVTCTAEEEARYLRLGYDEDCSVDKAAALEPEQD